MVIVQVSFQNVTGNTRTPLSKIRLGA